MQGIDLSTLYNGVNMNDIYHANDLLGLPLEIGDSVLCISGTGRQVESVKAINHNSILTETDKEYFLHNVLGINDIIKDNTEYFIDMNKI